MDDISQSIMKNIMERLESESLSDEEFLKKPIFIYTNSFSNLKYLPSEVGI